MPFIMLKQDEFPRGRGYWKFNNELLQDKQFVEMMNRAITVELDNYEYDSHKEKWEYMKIRFRGVCLEFSARKQKQNREEIDMCEKN